MRKFLIALLLSFSCALTVMAIGCSGEDSSPSESSPSSNESSSPAPAKENYTLHFTSGVGFDYASEAVITNSNPVMYESLDGVSVEEGSTVTFAVQLGAFYAAETGYPNVFVNGQAIAGDDGVYSFTVAEESTITVSGVVEDESNMEGDGSFENAFVVTRPIDLVYIAEQVNAGNQAYVRGAYVLANDIDCGGEELKIIGDNSSEYSYFSGCFTTETNPDTGTTTRHTISNFKIKSDDANYVGLFGTVFVDPSVQSSGLFYGIRLKDFTMEVSLDNPPDEGNLTIACGGLIGYANGATMYMCDALNGSININCDESYFSYAGGLIGWQQAYYNETYGSFASEIAYSAVDVDINVVNGSVLFAGGIVGYTATNYPLTQAFIHNSYATGSVYGAMRAGGIVGGLGQYTSVSNCYATGDVTARVNLEPSATPAAMKSYLHAYAGGMVGYAENDTIVNDSFFNGKTEAFTKSGDAQYSHVSHAIAGGDEAGTATATAQKYIAFRTFKDLDVSKIATLKNMLKWDSIDWVFANNAYPQINYEPANTSFTTTLTVEYVTKAVDGNDEPIVIKVSDKTQTTYNYFDSAEDSYFPVSDVFAGGTLPLYYTADNGFLSYGYYLDEACTMQVPYAYVSTTDVVFYVGFADVTPVLGTYSLLLDENTEPLTLTFKANGRVEYTDGSVLSESNFSYDGESIVIENARLARYYNGPIDTETSLSADFDMYRYLQYDFKATFSSDGVMSLYDGTYFTKDAPLTAMKNLFMGEYYTANGDYYTFYGNTGFVDTLEGGRLRFTYTTTDNGLLLTYTDNSTATLDTSTLLAFDAFRGKWVKSATVNKTFRFDGEGGFTSDDFSGVYTDNGDGSISFTYGGVNYKAEFNGEGILEIVSTDKTQLYYLDGSYKGTWVSGRNKVVSLTLHGLNKNGVGTAYVAYSSGYTFDLTYELSETENYACLYWDSAVFGYFKYTTQNNKPYLMATLYNPVDLNEDYTSYTLHLVDDFDGAWISNNPTFNTLEFSGLGIYDNQGYITITDLSTGNETKVRVEYTLSSDTITGHFSYGGVTYTLTYDEDDKSVTITINGENATQMERKDRFAADVFVDEENNAYVFDGKGALVDGGKITVNGTMKYGYKYVNDTTYHVYDGAYEASKTAIGSVTVESNCYKLTINGVAGAEDTVSYLYIQNELMGTWAIGGQFATFEIGATDTNGVIQGTFKKTETFAGYPVEISYLSSTTLTFSYYEGNHPYTYYIYLYPEYPDSLVLSEYTNIYSGEYSICSKVDKMYGTWTKSETTDEGIRIEDTFRFDGVQSQLSANGGTVVRNYTEYYVDHNGKEKVLYKTETKYFYLLKDSGIVMWSQELLAGKTLYYKIELTADGDYKNATSGLRFNRAEVDSLYLTVAVDKSTDITYVFDGGNVGGNAGMVTASNDKVYEYKITAFNSNKTATILFTDTTSGETYTATLDYSKQAEITITLVKNETQS